jgi:hypothetical protein
MTIPAGHRFEATQALRQTLARAVSWGLIHRNPAKEGVENSQRPLTQERPFESWTELHQLAEKIGPRYGPLVVFAAATGLIRRRCGACCWSQASRHRAPAQHIPTRAPCRAYRRSKRTLRRRPWADGSA